MKKEWWIVIYVILILIGALLFYPYAMNYEEPRLSPSIYYYGPCIWPHIYTSYGVCTTIVPPNKNIPKDNSGGLTTAGEQVDRLLDEVGDTLEKIK